MSLFASLAEHMEPSKLRYPVLKFHPEQEKLLLTPIGTAENNYQPDPIDVSDQPFILDRNKIDIGWRCYATGYGVKEVVARYPATLPVKPKDTYKNRKGDAAWNIFARAYITLLDYGKVIWEIDRDAGGLTLLAAFETMLAETGDVYQMVGVVEVDDIPTPSFVEVALDDDK